MDNVSLEIPAEVLEAARLTPDELKTELALLLYQQERLSYARAAALAGNENGRFDQLLKEKEQKSAAGTIDLDDFLSWAAHDLKTPLNAIIGFSKVVLKGIDGPINEIQKTDLTSVHVNGQRMLALVSNLVDMARLNRGEAKTAFAQGDLLPLLEEAATRWKAQNPAKELITISMVSSPDWPLNLDPSRVRQIVTNMLAFAALYIEEDCKITMTLEEEASRLAITIKSSGAKVKGVSKMDTVMLTFITRALLGLHGGVLDECQESEQGASVKFAFPR